MKYKKVIQNSEILCIVDMETKEFIPVDEANTQYKLFLEWVAAGNTPDEQVLGV